MTGIQLKAIRMILNPYKKNTHNLAELEFEKAQLLWNSAKEIGLCEKSSLGANLEVTGASLAPVSQLTGAVEKVLAGLHKIPEILDSTFWQSVDEPARGSQWQLCHDFIQAGRPISGRVRVDSVVSKVDGDNSISGLIEFEPHAGDDNTLHAVRTMYQHAQLWDQVDQKNYLDLLAAAHRIQSPNQAGKIRIVQWDSNERTDIDYRPTSEKLLAEFRYRGLDAQQFLYDDPAADWDDALIYRIFEFSEIHESAAQQYLIDGHNQGRFKLANPAFVFGKLVAYFATEFSEIFQSRLGLTANELLAFPHTFSSKEYLQSRQLQRDYDYTRLFLKGVLSEGSGGGNDVYPLKNFGSQAEALAFIRNKTQDDVGGWILQQEVQRERFNILQHCESTGEIHENENAGILQRQIFINSRLIGHYNLTSSRLNQTSDVMHVESGVAVFI